MEAVHVGVIGVGYWGPKLVRNLVASPGARVVWVADRDQRRLDEIKSIYPHIRTTLDYQEMLADDHLDAIVLATPVGTHARIGGEALSAGKHLLVEKPLTHSVETAEELLAHARDQARVLMVGHTFLFHPAVRLLRQLVLDHELGEIYYANAQRLNLGVFQRDINVLWDLAPHDLSILMYVLDLEPLAIAARGHGYVRPEIEDVAYLDVQYPGRISAAIHLSWLDPNKVRRLTVVGSKKMAVYDDVEPLEKIRVYDKGVDAPPHTNEFGAFHLSYRYGDIIIPHVPGNEPLRLECEHFLDCIRKGETPLTDARQGLAVVQALAAAQSSLLRDGERVALDSQLVAAIGRATAPPLDNPLHISSVAENTARSVR